MIDPQTARTVYVIPALSTLGLYSLAGEQLLMGTAATESNFKNFGQFGGGPARGTFQTETDTSVNKIANFWGRDDDHFRSCWDRRQKSEKRRSTCTDFAKSPRVMVGWRKSS